MGRARRAAPRGDAMDGEHDRRTCRRDVRAHERGGVLIVALVAMVLAVSLAFATTSLSTARRSDVARDERDLQARATAEAGVERAIAWAAELAALDPAAPFAALDALAGQTAADGSPLPFVLADGELLAGAERSYGRFTVTVAARADGAARELRITSTGHVPDPDAPLAKATAHALVRLAPRTAPGLEFAYFVNHWAWLYSSRINVTGNAGSNGQFDCGDKSPGLFGTPRYRSVALADPAHPDLVGYLDDNGDGVTDGSDGGVYAAWDIVRSGRARGMGALQQNQHAFGAPFEMPQLADLRGYEAAALAAGASVSVAGGVDASGAPLPPTELIDAIAGDESGEPQHVVLIGTAERPIVLNGPVVVRGDLIIKGVVTGRGSIYAGGNVYIADDLTYANAPSSWTAPSMGEADLEAWLTAEHDRDFCGLFARESVVMGDFTDSNWRSWVDRWLDDPLNESSEDAGVDGVPGTRDGKDAIPGTADDDLLEGDDTWTVERYTQAHADAGILPAGKAVGDPIPGTGEDVDGDGVEDGKLTLDDFDLAAALDSGEWGGNLPAGVTDFADLASTQLSTIEAAVATNHAAAMASFDYANDFNLRGSLVARVEAMIAAAPKLNFTIDLRLLGGGIHPELLPQVLAAPQIVAWQWSGEDLHTLLAAAKGPTP